MINEKEEILEMLEEGEIKFFELEYKLREDPEIVLAYAKLHSKGLMYIGSKLRKDESFMKKLIEIDGDAIAYATQELKDNDELAEMAVKKSGYALQYLSSRLRNDPKIVKEAVKQNGDALQFARKGIKDNDEIVKVALMQNGEAVRYASDRLKKDEEIGKIAVKNRGVALGDLDKELKANKEIVLLAVKQCGGAITYADSKLKGDIDVVTQAAIQNEDILYWGISPEIKDNPKIMEQIRATVKKAREDKNKQIREIDSQVTPEQRKMALSEIAKMKKLMIKSNDKKIQMDKSSKFETKPINEFMDKDEEER